MTSIATLMIGDRSWLVPTVGLVVVAILVIWHAYRVSTVSHRIRASASSLKIVGFTILALCLVEPLWSSVRARPGANLFLLLADNSQSMQIQDETQKQSRGEVLQKTFKQKNDGKQKSWQVRLAQDFDVRRYQVDSRLQQVKDFEGLTFQGTATAVNTAFATLRNRFEDRPLGGILFFTDGNITDLQQGDLDLDGLPPIYPVVVGGKETLKDIALDKVSISQTSFEDAPVTIKADITTTGCHKKTIVIQLQDEAGELVEQQKHVVQDESSPHAFRFQFLPKKNGITFYKLHVALEEEVDQLAGSELSSESTVMNNSQIIKIDRGEGAHRILYVSGRPNWEYKFLRRAIENDNQIDLVGLIRVAKKEAKFDFRGRAGESSNSLFRGFKKKSDEETESYDQPVFVRLNTKSSDELRDGFPKTEKELYSFKAIILDDVESAFFSHDQMALLQRFVTERGGGLLVLGGQESFHNGEYRHTPIGEMLPVYIDRSTESQPKTQYSLTLTRDGWLQPWVRLRKNEQAEQTRLDQMTSFRTLNRVHSIKPGAVSLASATSLAGDVYPALIAQRFGRGRSAAITIGDLWRWQLKQPEEKSQDDLGKAWRQMLRWLAVDVPTRIDATIKPLPELVNNALQIQIKAHDAEFQPLDNANVRIAVTSQSSDETAPLKSITLDAEPSLKQTGLYEAIYVPREMCAYRADVIVSDFEGKKVGTAQMGWVSDPAAEEFRAVAPNQNLMKQIAETTGGEVIAIDRLPEFVSSLTTKSMPVTEQWTSPLWDRPWIFLIAVGCLIGEWGIRRWKGLP